MFVTSPNQWDAVFGITSAARAVGWPSHRGGNETDVGHKGRVPPMRRSPTQNGWVWSGWGNAGAPPSGGRRAGLAQWQSSLDSWLSSALLSSSHDDVDHFSPNLSPTTPVNSIRCCCPLTCSPCLPPRRHRRHRRHRHHHHHPPPSLNKQQQEYIFSTICFSYLFTLARRHSNSTHVIIIIIIILLTGRVCFGGSLLLLFLIIFVLIIILLLLSVLWEDRFSGMDDDITTADLRIKKKNGRVGTYRFFGLRFRASWFRRSSPFLKQQGVKRPMWDVRKMKTLPSYGRIFNTVKKLTYLRIIFFVGGSLLWRQALWKDKGEC